MNINPYAKGAASGAYEQGVKTAADYAGVTSQLEQITNLDVAKFGVVGDGVADDSDALQDWLDAGAGKITKLPAGEYKITKTLHISTGTTIYGEGSASHIVLGDGHSLDAIDWRGTNTYPMVVTDDDSSDVAVKNIKITGNKTALASQLQYGLCIRGCDNCLVENVDIEYINYYPEAGSVPTGGYGWNLFIYDSTNVTVRGGKYTYGGYECVGTEDAENVLFDGVYSGIGWRTSLQLHRGSKNIKISGCTIEQNEAHAHSSLTFHGASDNTVENVLVVGTYISGTTDNTQTYRGGIQSVYGFEHFVTIADCIFDVTNNAISTSSDILANKVSDWIVVGNRISAGARGIDIRGDNAIIRDNIINAVGTAVEITGANYSVSNNTFKNNTTVTLTGVSYFNDNNGLPVVMSDLTFNAAWKTGTPAADPDTDVITLAAHGFADNQPIEFDAGTGALPAGISAYNVDTKGGEYYYVINATTDTFKISLTRAGAAVDITDAGTSGWRVRSAFAGSSLTNPVSWAVAQYRRVRMLISGSVCASDATIDTIFSLAITSDDRQVFRSGTNWGAIDNSAFVPESATGIGKYNFVNAIYEFDVVGGDCFINKNSTTLHSANKTTGAVIADRQAAMTRFTAVTGIKINTTTAARGIRNGTRIVILGYK